MRNPKRTAASASALMIGVGLVGFITIFVSSTKASIDAGIDRAFTGDLVVDSGAGVDRRRRPGAGAAKLNALPEVAGGDRPARQRSPRSTAARSLLVRHRPARPRSTLHRPAAVAGPSGGPRGAGHHRRLRGRRATKGLRIGDHGPGGVQGHRPAAAPRRDDLRRGAEATGPSAPTSSGTPAYDGQLRRPTSTAKVLVKQAPRCHPVGRRCAAVDDVVDAYPGRRGAWTRPSSAARPCTRR